MKKTCKGVWQMTIDEAIEDLRQQEYDFSHAMCDTERPLDDLKKYQVKFEYCQQLADWLEELKELRAYIEKMEMQYLDDISNPLEPLKLTNALKSEIFKYNYRKEHKPKDINPLDYTIMYALKHCLEEQIKENRE